jgi:short-subunit dehydrogenase
MALALITGASSGIGKELALRLGNRGLDLILTGRNSSQLDKIASQIKSPVTCIKADLAKKEGREKIAKAIFERSPDLVINNAGFGLYGKSCELSIEEQSQMCEVNMLAPFEITHAAIASMKKQGKGGVIVNVSSIAGDLPTPFMSVYGATKAFLTSFSIALDLEMRLENIRILSALPGQVTTEFSTRAAKKKVAEASFAMSVEKAAKEILWQIDKRKTIHRFDYRYWWLSMIARHFLPDFLIGKCVTSSLKNRL